jgi:GEVED domain
MFRIFRQLGSIRQGRAGADPSRRAPYRPRPPRPEPTVEALEDRLVPAVFDIANFDVPGLIKAITDANGNGEADTINLAPGGSYVLTAVAADAGPNGLPIIATDGGNPLKINGNGATILRAPGAPVFRIIHIVGKLTLDRATIANGDTDIRVGGSGGGILVDPDGALVLTNSAVVNNKAESGGGGIAIFGGSATIINCTISGNSAGTGGGISMFDSRVTILNSTVAHNTAGVGGGIEIASLQLGATTILTLESTLVANNTAPTGADLFRSMTGPLTTVNTTRSLIEAPQAGAINGTNTDNLIGQDPMLGPLQNNGGPTPTLALLGGSPALDKGSNLANLATDQRGAGFARVHGAAADIGAFEMDLIPPPPPPPPPPPTDDFGDAPAPFPTLLADNGARHRVVPGFQLGSAVDAEADGQPHPFAAGDDLPGNPDDEDGVVFTTALTAGRPAGVTVTASQPGLLHAWIDFNNDGDWDDAEEQVFANQVLAAGPNELTFSVPAAAVPGARSSARFRFSTQASLQPTGPAPDGEVEDYTVVINAAPPADPPPPQQQPQASAVVPLADVTAQVSVTRGRRLRFDRRTGKARLWLRLTNNGPDPLAGPISFVLVGLPRRVKLRSFTGLTVLAAPRGASYQDLPLGPWKQVLVTAPPAAGAAVTDLGGAGDQFLAGETRPLRLTFANPAGGRFRFHWRILAGGGVR